MSKPQGSGWWRQTRRHREAALKGTHGKRTSHSKAKKKEGRISQVQLDALRAEYRDSRSPRSVSADLRTTSKNILDPTDPKQVRRWKRDPSRADLDGVDTESQNLYRIKVETLPKVESRKEYVKKIVENARNRAKALRSRAKTGEDTSEALKRAANEAREALTLAGRDVEGIFGDAKKEQDSRIRTYQGKWSAERRKRAETVAGTVGCTMFEADAMIARAKRAGLDHDLVDWDAIQGKDLEFSERVERLERQLGRETMTKSEEDHYVDWQLEKAEGEFSDFMAEQEERLVEEFGGDYDAMYAHDQHIDRRREEAMSYSYDPHAYG